MNMSQGQDVCHGNAIGNAAERENGLSTIGDMARDFGLSFRALRFYEDRGLLHPLRRGTARLYDERERSHLKLILKGKQLGFTLAEIREILNSRGDANEAFDLEMALPCEQILAQISHLERQRNELDDALCALRQARQRFLPCSAEALSTST